MKYRYFTIITILSFIMYNCSVTRHQNYNCETKWESYIEGVWESIDDTNFILMFKEGKVTWYYKYKSWEIDTLSVFDYFLSNSSCDLSYLDRNMDNNIFISYVSNEDTLCYEFTGFSNKYFTYISTSIGNIQSFRKIRSLN